MKVSTIHPFLLLGNLALLPGVARAASATNSKQSKHQDTAARMALFGRSHNNNNISRNLQNVTQDTGNGDVVEESGQDEETNDENEDDEQELEDLFVFTEKFLDCVKDNQEFLTSYPEVRETLQDAENAVTMDMNMGETQLTVEMAYPIALMEELEGACVSAKGIFYLELEPMNLNCTINEDFGFTDKVSLTMSNFGGCNNSKGSCKARYTTALLVQMLQSAGFKCDFDASLLVEETPVPASAEVEEGE